MSNTDGDRYACSDSEYRRSWEDYPPLVVNQDGEVLNPPTNPLGIRFVSGSIKVQFDGEEAE